MVFGILAATVAVPAVIGTTEAVRQGQRQNRQEEHRGRKSELVVSVSPSSTQSKRREELEGALVVLWRNRLWIRPQRNEPTDPSPLDDAHPFNGYFLKHPHQQRWRQAGHDPHGEGLVSTISHEPPMLNWVYVDPQSHQIKYGTRPEVDEAEGIAGPWDVTKGVGTDKGTGFLGGGRRMTFEGWEGFVTVEEEVDLGEAGAKSEDHQEASETRTASGQAEQQRDEGASFSQTKSNTESSEDEDEDEDDQESDNDDQGALWADAEEQARHQRRDPPKTMQLWGLYFDVKDDGLSSGDRIGKEYWKREMLEVEVTRREMRRTRDAAIGERVDRLKQRKKVDEKNESVKTDMEVKEDESKPQDSKPTEQQEDGKGEENSE